MALSFGFGGDTGTSYEDLKRRRAYAEAMQMRGGQGQAKTAMQGLNSAAQSITGALLAKKLGKQIGAEQDEFGMLFNGALGGLGAQQPMGGAPGAPMDATSSVPSGEMASFIKQGLVERGLPEHVADGFVMNFKDESGLNPGINEQNPLVEGSRGGFGLAQWTGPRRKALEAYAQQRGTNVSDPNLQMDFLMEELRGSESSAAQRILGAKDSGSAAAAIVNNFLRPAEEHRTRRAAAYTGGQSPTGGVNPMLLSMIGDPRATDQQRSVLQMLMQQQLQQADPMRQLQMQNMQSQIDARNNPAPVKRDIVTGADGYQYYTDDQSRVLPGVQLPQGPSSFIVSGAQAAEYNLPDDGKAYQVTVDGNNVQAKAVGGGGVTVNNNTSGPQVGTIPQGYQLHQDPDTKDYSMVPIPGGPEDTTKQEERAEGNAATASDIVTNAAALAREAASDRSVGGAIGRVASLNPASENAELYRQVEVLKSQAKVGNLNAMRAASPTGGALGSVTEGELQMLADMSGALDPASPNFVRDLDNYERTLLRVIHGNEAGNSIYDETRGGDDGGWQNINGVKVRVKK